MFLNMNGQQFEQPETVVNVFNYQLTWDIGNIYMHNELLDTTIAGPAFGGKLLSFPWALKLGQTSRYGDVKGISLIIQRTNVPKGDVVLVNFWVCISRKYNGKILLNQKYQAPFGYRSRWKSPMLVTNDAFRKESASYSIYEGWIIEVQLMWNEDIEFGSATNADSSFYRTFKQVRKVGLDLKKFYNTEWLRDIYIGSGTQKIPVHWPILASRCPYLAKQFQAHTDEKQQLDDSFISSCNPEVIEAFFVYLYSGDIYSIAEKGPLPLGLDTLAQRTEMGVLQDITSPLFFSGTTTLYLESLTYDWTIDHEQIANAINKSTATIDSEFFGGREVFTLHVTIDDLPKSSVPSISAYLMVRRMERYARTYAIADLRMQCGEEGEVSYTRAIDYLTPGSCMHFPCVSDLDFDKKDLQLFLKCEIRFSRDGLRTCATTFPDECRVESDRTLPDFDFINACTGWISMRAGMLELLNGNFSDCVIVVDDGSLTAHRVVLAARSLYFSNVLAKKEVEQKGSSFRMEIHVHYDIAVSLAVMKVILEALYVGCNDISDERMVELIRYPAKFFGVEGLRHRGVTIF